MTIQRTYKKAGAQSGFLIVNLYWDEPPMVEIWIQTKIDEYIRWK